MAPERYGAALRAAAQTDLRSASPSTEAIDRREKKESYEQTPTLEEYVIVAQERREVTIFRRATGWIGETYAASEATIEFRSVKQAMTHKEIYEDVRFA